MSYCGSGSQPAGSTTTTSTSSPWPQQQPYLEDVFSQAKALDNSSHPAYYPGSTYSPLTDTQNNLINSAVNYGTQGGDSSLQAANSQLTNMLSPSYTAGTQGAFDQGQGVLSNEMSPGYLNPWNSPSFGTVVNNTLASVLPATSASFINGGRTDSGLATAAQTQAAMNAVGGLAQNQYNTNQNIQNSAAAQAANNLLTQQGTQARSILAAPMVDQTQLGDLSAGLNAAGMTQQELQANLNAAVQAWNYNEMLPYNQLGLYNSMIQGNYGGTGTTTQPYFQNQGANIMSGIGGAVQLASLIGSLA